MTMNNLTYWATRFFAGAQNDKGKPLRMTGEGAMMTRECCLECHLKADSHNLTSSQGNALKIMLSLASQRDISRGIECFFHACETISGTSKNG
jgi:hypothetical protein